MVFPRSLLKRTSPSLWWMGSGERIQMCVLCENPTSHQGRMMATLASKNYSSPPSGHLAILTWPAEIHFFQVDTSEQCKPFKILDNSASYSSFRLLGICIGGQESMAVGREEWKNSETQIFNLLSRDWWGNLHTTCDCDISHFDMGI